MIIISKAEDIDRSILHYIDYICFADDKNYNYEFFEELLNLGTTYVAIDTEFDKIVGYAIFTIKNKTDIICPTVKPLFKKYDLKYIIELSSIGILPEYRGKKISYMLLNSFEQNVPMCLHVKKTNVIAQKTYEKNGWKFSSFLIKNYYGNGEDGLLMYKNL